MRTTSSLERRHHRLISRWAQVKIINYGANFAPIKVTRAEFISKVGLMMKDKPPNLDVVNKNIRAVLEGKGFEVAANTMHTVGSDESAVYLTMVGRISTSAESAAIVMFGGVTLVS